LDHSAELAEQHAQRLSDHRDDATRHVEQERAQQARDAARRARIHAHLLRQQDVAQ
jgi:hypothetical protein